MNELLHTILLRVTLAGAASAAALRMAGSGAMRETVRLAAGLLMLAALLQPLGSLRSAGWSVSAAPDTQAIRETNMQTAMSAVASSIAKALDDIFRVAEERGETPLIVVCDGIEDPHNLGAIIRSAETAGAHGVIIPKRRAVGLTASVARSAAGALAYVGVHKANNLASTLDELKERGVWLFGAEADGTVDLYEAPFDRATAIVIGSEGQGLSRLTRDKCDYIVSIPMRGRVNSLNASNAAAVLLFEALRRRLGH